MEIVRWAPFRELTKMEDRINKLFEEGFDRSAWQLELPTTDMYEEGGNLVIEANLPKFKEDEIEISTYDSTLEIKAQHSEETETKERKYVMRESSSGSFWRRLTVPSGAKLSEAKANMAGGVLKIIMPLAELPEPNKISITAGEEK